MPFIHIFRFIKSFTERNYFTIDDAFPLIVPVVMYLFGGGATLYAALKWFFIIATIASFIFGLIGFNAGIYFVSISIRMIHECNVHS